MPTTNRLDALRLQLVATEMSLRVGKRIRQRREELGIRTQRELADLLPSPSVTNQTINKWETGANEPGPKYKTMLAEALHVDVAYFIAEEPKSATPDLSRAAGQDDVADRLKRIEDALIEGRKERTDQAREIRGLLKRQDGVLKNIEDAIKAEERARRDAEEATRLLLAAVDAANRALLAGAQPSEEAREPRAK